MNTVLRNLFSTSLLVTVSLACFSGDVSLTSLEIKAELPAGVKTKSNEEEAYFEFCPDNTCDLIRAGTLVAESDLLELGYLYMFYFSDYNELENWRKKASSGVIAKNILTMKKYANCQEELELNHAKCILDHAKARLALSIYFVRYDENENYYQVIKFPDEK